MHSKDVARLEMSKACLSGINVYKEIVLVGLKYYSQIVANTLNGIEDKNSIINQSDEVLEIEEWKRKEGRRELKALFNKQKPSYSPESFTAIIQIIRIKLDDYNKQRRTLQQVEYIHITANIPTINQNGIGLLSIEKNNEKLSKKALKLKEFFEDSAFAEGLESSDNNIADKYIEKAAQACSSYTNGMNREFADLIVIINAVYSRALQKKNKAIIELSSSKITKDNKANKFALSLLPYFEEAYKKNILSLSGIADFFNKHDLGTPSGSKFHAKTVSNYLDRLIALKKLDPLPDKKIGRPKKLEHNSV